LARDFPLDVVVEPYSTTTPQTSNPGASRRALVVTRVTSLRASTASFTNTVTCPAPAISTSAGSLAMRHPSRYPTSRSASSTHTRSTREINSEAPTISCRLLEEKMYR
jgi:hypothetical protein